ncbi:uncharacterized protein [Engystomops pustulosus]|uniref:uncharacterized protein n=1 Tax=Engystomops pustulosus TaxID=76066 RepID=UPI003AFA3BAB
MDHRRNVPLLTSKYRNLQDHQTMCHKLSKDARSTPEEITDLHITGISVSKLHDKNRETHGLQKAPVTQHGGRNVTWAQTSGWRLKAVPTQNVPVICAYSRPLKVTLQGHPLIASSSRAQNFVHHFGRNLAPADSELWWNYRFAAYTILSRNPGKPFRASQRIDNHDALGPSHLQRSKMKTWSKPRVVDVSTQTRSKDVQKDLNQLEAVCGTGRPGNLEKRMRELKSGPPRRCGLSVPGSHKPSFLPVMSPEPWPSSHTPEAEEISISVPLLPTLLMPGH